MNKKSMSVRVLVAALVAILSVVLIITGIVGLNRRGGAGLTELTAMRDRAVMIATSEGAVESYVTIEKEKARAEAKAQGLSMKELKTAVQKAEEAARANYVAGEIDFSAIDMAPVTAALNDLSDSQVAFYAEKESAEAAYIAQMEATAPVEDVLEDAAPEEASSEEGAPETEMAEDAMMTDEEPEVDMSGFVATSAMNQLQADVDAKYAAVGAALINAYEGLDQTGVDALKTVICDIVTKEGDDFATRYDRYASYNTLSAVDNATMARITRHGDDLISVGIGLLILALVIAFYPLLIKKMGMPRLIISMFFLLLCIVTLLCDLSLPGLLSNTLVRMGMNSILVLAMVPGIQCGIGLNLGLPIGIVAGLIGGLIAIEFKVAGLAGFVLACIVGMAIAAIAGWLYGMLLNRLKGSEMSVTTYVGFSIVSVMCIAWLVMPFKSLELRWPLGTGLRNTVSMNSTFSHLLDNFLSFSIGKLTVPTGLLLFMLLCCGIIWLFSRSKTGIAMQAVGNNPRFAEGTGISVDKMRVIGTVISTMLGAVGIIVYSQSYGFMQLYTAPRQMGFVAASAILIGGASTSGCKISHVLIGTFLFQGVLTLGMPVANALVPQSTISETMRILISNGIILYALTKSGGNSRG